MQDLSQYVQAGYYFGPGNPGNWGKDLDLLIFKSQIASVEVLRLAFHDAAKLHAQYWKNTNLIKYKWLRCSDWIVGEN